MTILKIIKQIIIDILTKIKKSFSKARKGEEKLNNILYWWGLLSYAICYFLIQPIIDFNKIKFLDIAISSAIILYYIWHIIVLRKCLPKKPKLTKEEKKKLKEEKRKELPKTLMRKLFLKESITKFNPPLTVTIIDLYIVTFYILGLF